MRALRSAMNERTASFLPEAFGRIVALHASSLPLAKLPNQGMSSGSEEEAIELGFWGPPEKVEVRHPAEYVDLKVPIDIEVPPASA